MKTILIAVVILSLGFFNPIPDAPQKLTQMEGVDEIYAERKIKPLNKEELKAVGMWASENREVKWEILRHNDGTYELVLYEEFEGILYKDYIKGVWGIDGGNYYYQDLESSDLYTEFDTTPTYEIVMKSTENEFYTIGVGSDEKPLESKELRVHSFELELWDKYSNNANSRNSQRR